MMHRFSFSLLTLALLLPSTVSALHPNITELRGRPLDSPGPSNLGSSAAISDQFVLVGDRSDSLFSSSRGAAQVFDARTGRFLRRLECPDTTSPTPNFGISVAVEGHLGLVGARGAFGNRGAAYLFDLRTGKLLQTLTAQDTMAGINLGVSVALENGIAAVGAPNYGVAPAPSVQGAVYLFDALEGNQLLVYQPPAAHAGMNFGCAVALQGRLMLVGAYGDNHAGSQSGSAFLFDWEANQLISKLTESDATGGRRFGGRVAMQGLRALISGDSGGNSKASWFDLSQAGASMTETQRVPDLAGLSFNQPSSVALEGDLALVGYPSDNTVALFDARNGREIGRFFAGNDVFGASVALSGGRAVVGMTSFSGPEGTTGAAFLIQPLALPLPAQRRAATGDTARGLGANFTRFTDAAIGSNPSYGAFAAQAGRAPGVWLMTDQDDRVITDPVAFKGGKMPDTGPETFFVNTVPRLIGVDEFDLLAEVTLTGPDVTKLSNRALIRGDDWFNGDARLSFRTGQTIGDWSDAEVAGFQDVVLSLDPVAYSTSAVGVSLRRGVAGVDKGNDSGALEINLTNSVINDTAHREGGLSPDVNDYGQFLGRVARGANGVFTFPAYRRSGSAFQLALWTSSNARVLLEGEPDPGMSGDTTGLVLAETIGSVMSDPLFRYSLRGVPARKNEALYHEGVGLIARKGESVGTDLLGGEGLIQRILGFWPVHEEAAIFLVKMSGRGFKASNDLALVLRQEDGTFLPLVQEGQLLPDAPGTRIGVIQRVDVDPLEGHYAVLVSLTGDKARNQALLTGHARAGNAGLRDALRLPSVALRKGSIYQGRPSSTVSRLRSLNLWQKTDRGGAGGKGSGQSINSDGIYIVEGLFDNKARELLVKSD